jgi:methionyl-tRNA formyltransferase
VRIAFFGLPLAALLLGADGHRVELAVLAPVEAPGRSRLLRTVGGERVLDAASLGGALEARVDAALAAAAPDLLVSWFWTRKLPARWIGAAPLGAIGVHPSLLPRHRGPNPFFHAIDAGDVETGVSVHRLTERYDDGDVLARLTLPIGDRDAWQLARALDRPSLRALRATVARFARGDVPVGTPQDEARATWAAEPGDAELGVDWSWPRARVLRRIRALAPVPGLALELCGLRFFVTRASATDEHPGGLVPGEAAAIGEPPRGVVVRTGGGAIRIDRAVFGADGPAEEGSPLSSADLAQLVASRTRAV